MPSVYYPQNQSDWVESALALPLHRAISETSQDYDTLYYSDGSIRSAKRTVAGTWKWKDRRIVLLRRNGRLRPGDDGGAPLILWYRCGEDDRRRPTGALRLLRGRCRASGIEGHPRHVRIRCEGPPRAACAGPDATGRGAAEEGTCAWRLRFRDAATARLWLDMLQDLTRRDLPAVQPSPSNSSNTEDDEDAVATPNPNRSHNNFWLRNWRNYVTIAGVLLRLCSLLYEWRNLVIIAFVLCILSIIRKVAGTVQCLLSRALFKGVTKKVIQNPSQPPEVFYAESNLVALDIPLGSSSSKLSWIKGTLLYGRKWNPLLSFSGQSTEPPPPLRPTLYRHMVRRLFWHADHFESTQIAAYCAAVLAATMLLISVASLIHRAAPALSSALWKARCGPAAAACFALSAALGHDAFVNHWTAPLRYGLYWTGWVQSLVAAGFLCAGKEAGSRALGLLPPPIERRLSAARKVSAVCSGCVVTMAAPLALRCVYEAEGGYNSVAGMYGGGSLLAFFVGLYFLGRAVRYMTIFNGIPLGLYIHRFSLFPARFAYTCLYCVGDAARLGMPAVRRISIFLLEEVFFPTIKVLGRAAIDLFDFCHAAKISICGHLEKVLTSVCLFLIRIFLLPMINMSSRVVHCFSELCKSLLGVCRGFLASSYQIVKAHQEVISSFGRHFVEAAINLFNFCHAGAISICGHLEKFLTSACLFLMRIFLLPVINMSSRVVHCFSELCNSLLGVFRGFLTSSYQIVYRRMRSVFSLYIGPTLRLFFKALNDVGKFLIKILKAVNVTVGIPFVKKYWQLVPVGLILSGSFKFARASFESKATGNLASTIKYALGSWALFLIGITTLHTVLSSHGETIRQQVIVEDSIFSYVDFHLGYAVKQTVLSGWHALGTILKLILNGSDILIRKGFEYLWISCLWLYENYLKRPLEAVRLTFWIVWNSPELSLSFSLFLFYSVYLNHIGAINIQIPEHDLGIYAATFRKSYQYFVIRIPMALLDCYRVAWGYILHSPPVLLVTKILGDIYMPIITAETASPSAAFTCWGLSCAVKWTRYQVRLKIFAIPAMYFYFAGSTSVVLFRAFIFSYSVWIVLSMIVDRYESEQRRLAGEAFSSFQKRPVNEFHQTECCICLEVLDDAENKKIALPCGHEFHEPCISDWLVNYNRCPLCRRAAGGLDRALEVAF